VVRQHAPVRDHPAVHVADDRIAEEQHLPPRRHVLFRRRLDAEADFLEEARTKTLASKKFLYETLKKEGYSYIPSSTNFVLFPVKMDGEKFANELMKRGVGVRFWKFENKDWCRISIGRMDEMEAFAAAFKEIS